MQTLSQPRHDQPPHARSGYKMLFGLVGWLLLCFAAAGIGAVASIHAAEFYGQLKQPAWAPPAAVFGPVWTVLYALIGGSAWLVWRRSGICVAPFALTLFIVQLVLNALWSWLFFAWHKGGMAFVDVILLWAVVASTLIAFWRHSKVAGVMLVPYLLWVTFAAALNYSVWQLNQGRLG